LSGQGSEQRVEILRQNGFDQSDHLLGDGQDVRPLANFDDRDDWGGAFGRRLRNFF